MDYHDQKKNKKKDERPKKLKGYKFNLAVKNVQIGIFQDGSQESPTSVDSLKREFVNKKEETPEKKQFFSKSGFSYAKHYEPFNEKIYHSRPQYFPDTWLHVDLVKNSKSICSYSNRMARSVNGHIGTVVHTSRKMCIVHRKIAPTNPPISSLRVAWRNGKMSLKIQSVFLMLNRYAPVSCLTRTGINTALCIYASVSGAERAMAYNAVVQSKRLLILSWFHPRCESAEFRALFYGINMEKDFLSWLKSMLDKNEKLGSSYLNPDVEVPAPTTAKCSLNFRKRRRSGSRQRKSTGHYDDTKILIANFAPKNPLV